VDPEIKYKNSLPPAIVDVIKLVYRDLDKPELLTWYLYGKTQKYKSLSALM
jgi:hypothetical protein